MRRTSVVVVAIVIGLSLRITASATSTYLWQALDTGPSYEYNVTSIWDSSATYRAYWISRNADFDSEGVKTQWNTGAPWNFFPSAGPQPWALQTTGVRIMRTKAGNDYADMLNQIYSNWGLIGTFGYSESITLGYLRRTAHSGSGATIQLTECTYGADHFISAYPSIECSGLPQAVLGFAYSGGGPGLAVRYRCYNPSVGDHITATDSGCEGKSGYSVEGPVGWWRVGGWSGTLAWDSGEGDVSPFPDGAFLGPNSVIQDDDGTYYMSYLASPYYGDGGPYNQIFLASSTDGITFTPIVDANGMPRVIQSYTAGYPADVDSRVPTYGAAELRAAFGVGAGTLVKVNGQYRIFFMDSSRYTSASAPSCPNSGYNPPPGGTMYRWVTRSASSILDFANNPYAAGDCIRTLDASGAEINPFDYVTGAGGLSFVYDVGQSRYWLFHTATAADPSYKVVWNAGVVGSTTDFYVKDATLDKAGPIDGGPTSTYPCQTLSGASTDRLGLVSSNYGWYVYVGQDETSHPGLCGIAHAAITLFQPH